MKVIVVGAGGVTRELLRRLGETWNPVVIDNDEEQLEAASNALDLEAVIGDGSSLVALRRAGIDEADALIAASGDDDVNLEACRLAKERNVFRIAAVIAQPERTSEYRDLGVIAHSPDALTARWLELDLEPRRVASQAFAKGRAEAIELRVAADSPVQGKRLSELASASWLVSAILRDDKLIIPHGDTVISVDDTVTVVGSTASYGEIVRTFTAGKARFPIDHGRQVLVELSQAADLEGTYGEALYMARNTLADAVVAFHPASGEGVSELLEQAQLLAEGVDVEFVPASGSVPEAMGKRAAAGNVGVVVVRPQPRPRFAALRRPRAIVLSQDLSVPVLVARGTYPYKSIVVPARLTEAGQAASRAAVDIASIAESELIGLGVIDASFIAGAGAADEAREAAGVLKQEAAVQGVSVQRRIRRGNPVRIFEEFATDLAVLGLDRDSLRPFGLGVLDHLIWRLRSSILIVPVRE